MVKFVPPQDMFEYEADYYVNTVNTVGVPGAGVALQFANRCPQETKKYIDFCKSHQDYGVETLSGGDIFVYNNVVFAFTKEHYRNKDKQATAEAKKKKKQNEKPKAVIYGGYNTVQK